MSDAGLLVSPWPAGTECRPSCDNNIYLFNGKSRCENSQSSVNGQRGRGATGSRTIFPAI